MFVFMFVVFICYGVPQSLTFDVESALSMVPPITRGPLFNMFDERFFLPQSPLVFPFAKGYYFIAAFRKELGVKLVGQIHLRRHFCLLISTATYPAVARTGSLCYILTALTLVQVEWHTVSSNVLSGKEHALFSHVPQGCNLAGSE